MKRQQLQKVEYLVKKGTENKSLSTSTRTQYEKIARNFGSWVKEREGTERVPVERLHGLIQGYINERAERGCSPDTLKRDIAVLCNATHERMDAFSRPERHVGEQTKGRERSVETSRESLLADRTRQIAPFIGCRLAEYGRLKENSLIERNGQLFVRVEGGKGGKNNDYLVEREHETAVRAWFSDKRGENGYILAREEVSRLAHANLHSCRRERVQDLYARFCKASEPERARMRQEIKDRYLENPKKAEAYTRAMERVKNSPIYTARGSVREDLERKGLPINYEREALLYASVMTAHYREDIIVEHYMR